MRKKPYLELIIYNNTPKYNINKALRVKLEELNCKYLLFDKEQFTGNMVLSIPLENDKISLLAASGGISFKSINVDVNSENGQNFFKLKNNLEDILKDFSIDKPFYARHSLTMENIKWIKIQYYNDIETNIFKIKGFVIKNIQSCNEFIINVNMKERIE